MSSALFSKTKKPWAKSNKILTKWKFMALSLLSQNHQKKKGKISLWALPGPKTKILESWKKPQFRKGKKLLLEQVVWEQEW